LTVLANLARALYSLVRRGLLDHKALLGHKVQPVLRVHLGRRVQLAQSVHKAVLDHKAQPGHKVLLVLKVQ